MATPKTNETNGDYTAKRQTGYLDESQYKIWDTAFMAITDKADLSRITVVPGQRSGQPCIRELRITVWDVLDMLASGMAEDEILNDYPYLEKADFPAIYAYAS